MKWLAVMVGAFLLAGCNPPSGEKSGEARSASSDSKMVNEPDDGKTPMVRAVEKGAVAEVTRLLAAGASVNDGWQGQPLLYLAAEQGSLEMVKLLVGKGADPKVSNTYKVTALFYASSRPVVEYLVGQGLAVDAVNTYKETPLVIAAANGDLPNPFGGRAVGGQTALQLAKSAAMKELLAKAGAKTPAL